MRRLLLVFATALFSVCMYAEDGVVVLSTETYDTLKTTDTQTYYFKNTSVSLKMGGRNYTQQTRQNFSTGINFKNNTKYTIDLGSAKAYRIEFAGFSQGDNWCYLYGWGTDNKGGYEWTDPIGTGIKDNTKIMKEATYPLDPCESTISSVVTTHQAGYTFAAIDLTSKPYAGTFDFIFNGNNQERALIRIYTTAEAAKNAATGIESISAVHAPADNALYNISGQRVDNTYKGIVIQNGKKFFNK